jgi:hypothetical protein
MSRGNTLHLNVMTDTVRHVIQQKDLIHAVRSVKDSLPKDEMGRVDLYKLRDRLDPEMRAKLKQLAQRLMQPVVEGSVARPKPPPMKAMMPLKTSNRGHLIENVGCGVKPYHHREVVNTDPYHVVSKKKDTEKLFKFSRNVLVGEAALKKYRGVYGFHVVPNHKNWVQAGMADLHERGVDYDFYKVKPFKASGMLVIGREISCNRSKHYNMGAYYDAYLWLPYVHIWYTPTGKDIVYSMPSSIKPGDINHTFGVVACYPKLDGVLYVLDCRVDGTYVLCRSNYEIASGRYECDHGNYCATYHLEYVEECFYLVRADVCGVRLPMTADVLDYVASKIVNDTFKNRLGYHEVRGRPTFDAYRGPCDGVILIGEYGLTNHYYKTEKDRTVDVDSRNYDFLKTALGKQGYKVTGEKKVGIWRYSVQKKHYVKDSVRRDFKEISIIPLDQRKDKNISNTYQNSHRVIFQPGLEAILPVFSHHMVESYKYWYKYLCIKRGNVYAETISCCDDYVAWRDPNGVHLYKCLKCEKTLKEDDEDAWCVA